MKTGRQRLPVFLQRKIVLIVFLKIDGLGFGGNALARIVDELAAFFPTLDHTPFGAQILILFQAGTVLAVFTAAGHFLTEQHGVHLVFSMQLSYTNWMKNATLFFKNIKKYEK